MPALLAVTYIAALSLCLATRHRVSVGELEECLSDLSGFQQAGLAALIMLLTLFVGHCAPAFTRALAGDRWWGAIAHRLRARQRWNREVARSRLMWRIEDDGGARDPEALVEVRRTSSWLSERYPMNDGLLRPTALGNALAAAHEQIEDAYGLDARLAWPRLYQVLRKRIRRDTDFRSGLLDMHVSFFVLGVTATVASLVAVPEWSLGAMALWLAPLVTATVAYAHTVRAAVAYGNSLRVAFDLQRFDLYEALHLPAPADQEQERVTNAALSAQWRHSALFRPGSVAYPWVTEPRAESTESPESRDGLHRTRTHSRAETRTEPRPEARSGSGVEGRAAKPEPTVWEPPTLTGSEYGSGTWTGHGGPDHDDTASRPAGHGGTPEAVHSRAPRNSLVNVARKAGVLATAAAGLAAAAATPLVGSVALAGVGAAGTLAIATLSEIRRHRSKNQPAPAPPAAVQPPTLGYDHRPPQQGPVVQVGESIREALSPAPPTAFRGGVAVTMDVTEDVQRVNGEPEWHLRPGEPGLVVVAVGLGVGYRQQPQQLLAGLEGTAEELVVVAGRSAPEVDLDITVDAPFMRVHPESFSARVPVDEAHFQFAPVVSAMEPGMYDIRVAIYSSGRLVQALPMAVVVDDVPTTAPEPR
ncbi:hypothetical protein OG352_27450 [Streptomyces sp. NBC_01485]|uniref:hypothetical protein n=1 Tax=Streptomyces sp. NBC_01485 TaxID=2903884 RepID=UPI002E2F6771|nr:hypothetical protein [Streptomyces sp. NBC_01485]